MSTPNPPHAQPVPGAPGVPARRLGPGALFGIIAGAVIVLVAGLVLYFTVFHRDTTLDPGDCVASGPTPTVESCSEPDARRLLVKTEDEKTCEDKDGMIVLVGSDWWCVDPYPQH